MAASEKSLVKEISEDFLSCAICLENYKNPTLLPCLHTFCQQCLVTFKAKSGGVLKCATCRMQCDTPIQELKSNFFLTSLLDAFQRQSQPKTDHPPMCELCQEKTATHRCVDCPHFCCDVCVTIHERILATRSHEVLTIDKYREIQSRGHLEVQSKVLCSDHKNCHLEFYCDTCQVPVCLKCTIVKHRVPEHVHRDLQEVADEYKTQVREMLEQLKVKENQVKDEKVAAETAIEEIQNQFEVEKMKVKKRAEELIEKVKREEKMLIDALDESATMGLKDAAMNIDEIEFQHGNIASTHHYLEKLVHHGNAVHLLSTRLETMKRIKEMVARETKPQLSYDFIEFQPKSDLSHTLIGVVKSDVCPSKCTVENIPEQLVKGESVNLLITARDSRGKQIIPRQDVKVKMRNPDASWEDIDMSDNNDGTYHVILTGKIEGKQQVAITTGKVHIPGSPFHIPVTGGLVQTVGNTGQGQLSKPWGLTINNHGDFVTADKRNNRVTIHDKDGNYKQSFEFTDQFAKPFKPCDVAISDDNEYFMLDCNNKQVVVSDEKRKVIRKFGCSDKTIGIAINPVTKNVYVSDYITHCITKYTQGGVYINSFGRKGDEQEEFNVPGFLAINSEGMVYVPDSNNHLIQVFNSDDQFMFEFSSTGDSTMSYPKGVAIDKNNYVYVNSENKVTKYDSDGQFICRIDRDKDGLSRPHGVAVCNDGKIAVSDNNNNCIKVFVE
ncbi:E3 ubiquitin-protein ligase TRIM71-like [Saccoglossus kowalevskii]|uniref:E3 ubiquitin-protein ligase TRIM71-like n=1 Tax=Saccoglossus kowalevskii TaxID=10224 RepID=A0ABM0GPV5_SACKO|nr:PREDICTED: E3 ubiquitin-protein ligase TRIM71-like [Saccoglossus kowalevskii]